MAKLYVLGSGIGLAGQLTAQARCVIEQADTVFALLAEPFALDHLRSLKPDLISLSDHYGRGRTRDQSYAEMVQRIVEALDHCERVAAVFYGHPGVFVWPSHEAMRSARLRGHEATMLPGISAEDCLLADLEIDPGFSGLQSYEAFDFLVYPRRYDPSVPMVLWQLAVLGDWRRERFETEPAWLEGLARLLMEHYAPDHKVALYEAVSFPLDSPRIEWIELQCLSRAGIGQATTLFVPPGAAPAPDLERLRSLGLEIDGLSEAKYQRIRRQQFES